MAAKYRIGIIGNTNRGNYGHDVDRVWLEIPGCEIVGVSDPDAKGREAAVQRLKAPKGFADYRELLDETKPNIVSICPRWLDQHRELILAAADRGIHIFLEKPFCRSLAEADEIVERCEQNHVKLALAHQTRYSPKIRIVQQMIADGLIGDVLELRGRGKEDQRGGGEDLWVLGSHVMNLIHVFGGEAHWCFAQVLEGGQPVAKAHVREGAEGIGPLAGDQVTAVYGLDHGATAYFSSRRGVSGGRFGLQICGSKGVIEILTGYLPAVHYLPDPAWSPGRSGKSWIAVSSEGPDRPEPLKDGGALAGNILACRDLLSAIEDNRQPECSMYEGRTTIEMISAVFESHRQGRPVTLPLANRDNPLAKLA